MYYRCVYCNDRYNFCACKKKEDVLYIIFYYGASNNFDGITAYLMSMNFSKKLGKNPSFCFFRLSLRLHLHHGELVFTHLEFDFIFAKRHTVEARGIVLIRGTGIIGKTL